MTDRLSNTDKLAMIELGKKVGATKDPKICAELLAFAVLANRPWLSNREAYEYLKDTRPDTSKSAPDMQKFAAEIDQFLQLILLSEENKA